MSYKMTLHVYPTYQIIKKRRKILGLLPSKVRIYNSGYQHQKVLDNLQDTTYESVKAKPMNL